MPDYRDADYSPDIPNAEYQTNKQPYTPIGSFKFWAQKVLPTIYDDSLSYYEVLTKLAQHMNTFIENMDNFNESINNTNTAFNDLQSYVNSTKDTLVATYNELQDYVNHYFDSLDIQAEINAKLDAMASSGALTRLIYPFLPDIVTEWLEENVQPGTALTVDESLSIKGSAADAQRAGDIAWAFAPFNPYNELELLYSAENTTHNGITYTWGNHRCTVSGTSSAVSICNITPYKTPLPLRMVAGSTYKILYKTSDQNILLSFVFYDSNDNATYITFGHDDELTIPSTAVAFSCRLYVDANKTVSGYVREFALMSNTGSQTLTYFQRIVDYNSSNRLTPADVDGNTFFYSLGSRLSGFRTHDAGYYWIVCYQNYYQSASRLYVIVEPARQTTTYAMTSDGGETLDFGNGMTNLNLYSAFAPFNAYNQLQFLYSAENKVHNGVTYTWNYNRKCTVTGTSTSTSICDITPYKQPLPTGMVAGNTYKVIYTTTNSNILLNLVWYDSSDTPTYASFSRNSEVTIPANTVKFSCRLYVEANKDANGTVSDFGIMSSSAYEELTYFKNLTDYDSSNRLTPDKVDGNTYFYVRGNRLSGFGTDDNKYYWIWCYTNAINTNSRLYVISDYYRQNTYYGYSNDGGQTVDYSNRKNLVRILQIGSSYGMDTIEYAPYLMSEMSPSLDITFGAVYMSGGTFEQYSGWFDDNTLVGYYKKEYQKSAWNSVQQMTLKNILLDEKWDIILVNQGAHVSGVDSSYAPLTGYLWKMAQYVQSPVRFGLIMPHASLLYENVYTYTDLVRCTQNAYNSNMFSFLIPAGTAIQSARGTSLNNLGDRPGGLAADSTGHLQEGLPVMISGYVSSSVLVHELTGKYGAIVGCQTSPTQEWVTARNIPTQNGTSIGLTANNITIGQKCAVQAIKKPFEPGV